MHFGTEESTGLTWFDIWQAAIIDRLLICWAPRALKLHSIERSSFKTWQQDQWFWQDSHCDFAAGVIRAFWVSPKCEVLEWSSAARSVAYSGVIWQKAILCFQDQVWKKYINRNPDFYYHQNWEGGTGAVWCGPNVLKIALYPKLMRVRAIKNKIIFS